MTAKIPHTPTVLPDLAIVYTAISAIQGWPRNPKRHDLEGITESLKRFGMAQPLARDEETGKLVAGHGRLDALLTLKAQGAPPPGRIVVRDGEWFVPVLTGLAFKSEREAEAFLVADNRLSEVGGWDTGALAALLGDLQKQEGGLLGVGYTVPDIDGLLSELTQASSVNEDAPKVPPKETAVRLGDLWLLGRHRLLCGDATQTSDVARVLGGAKPHLMVTDPPYGVEYKASWRESATLGKHKRRATGEVLNDDQDDWRKAWALFPGDVIYCWHAGQHASSTSDSLTSVGFEIRAQIIWAKPCLVISRGHYHQQHEPCWYAVRKGATAHWTGDRKQSTLWQISNKRQNEDAYTEHSTQKPIECMRRPILNNSNAGQAVYDPFCGSGTMIIAAESTGRVCHAIELAPRYVHVALRRWEKFTGKIAKLDTGETLDELEKSRGLR